MDSTERVGGEGVGQENGRAAGTAADSASRWFDSGIAVRSPEPLTADGGGK